MYRLIVQHRLRDDSACIGVIDERRSGQERDVSVKRFAWIFFCYVDRNWIAWVSVFEIDSFVPFFEISMIMIGLRIICTCAPCLNTYIIAW